VAIGPRLAGDADLDPAVLAVDPDAGDEGLGGLANDDAQAHQLGVQ
jgi:hypothetical protein